MGGISKINKVRASFDLASQQFIAVRGKLVVFAHNAHTQNRVTELIEPSM